MNEALSSVRFAGSLSSRVWTAKQNDMGNVENLVKSGPAHVRWNRGQHM